MSTTNHVPGAISEGGQDTVYAETGYVLLQSGLVVHSSDTAAVNNTLAPFQARNQSVKAFRIVNPDGTPIGDASAQTLSDLEQFLREDQVSYSMDTAYDSIKKVTRVRRVAQDGTPLSTLYFNENGGTIALLGSAYGVEEISVETLLEGVAICPSINPGQYNEGDKVVMKRGLLKNQLGKTFVGSLMTLINVTQGTFPTVWDTRHFKTRDGNDAFIPSSIVSGTFDNTVSVNPVPAAVIELGAMVVFSAGSSWTPSNNPIGYYRLDASNPAVSGDIPIYDRSVLRLDGYSQCQNLKIIGFDAVVHNYNIQYFTL